MGLGAGVGVWVAEGDDGGIAQFLHTAITHLIKGEAGDIVSPLPPQHSHNPASWQSRVTACVFFRLLAVIFFCKINEKISQTYVTLYTGQWTRCLHSSDKPSLCIRNDVNLSFTFIPDR